MNINIGLSFIKVKYAGIVLIFQEQGMRSVCRVYENHICINVVLMLNIDLFMICFY
jgi:hypothetical protein